MILHSGRAMIVIVCGDLENAVDIVTTARMLIPARRVPDETMAKG